MVDARGKWVTPGFVDLHVHLREPGQEYKESVATGTRAAVAGGFTSVCAMPNTVPANDNTSVTELMLARAAAAGLARGLPGGGRHQGAQGRGACRVRPSSVRPAAWPSPTTGARSCTSAMMRRALEYSRAFGLPLAVHEEDLNLVGKGVMNEGPTATRLGLKGVPAQAEDVMVLRDLSLLELTGGRLHVATSPPGQRARAIRAARRRALPVTAEVTPHHLVLTDEDVAASDYDPDFKMNPPLRSAEDVTALREGLVDGTIDAIATDHAPHSPEEKTLEFDAAPFGVLGLETALPALVDALLVPRAITLLRLVEVLSTAPARAFSLPYGTLAEGAPADVVLFSTTRSTPVTPDGFQSRSKNSPWLARTLKGRVERTWVGGLEVFARGSGATR